MPLPDGAVSATHFFVVESQRAEAPHTAESIALSHGVPGSAARLHAPLFEQ